MNNIKVKYCTDCPFSSWSTSGHKALARQSGRVRLMHHCNLQPGTGTEWNRVGKYECFENCPLKERNINVRMA